MGRNAGAQMSSKIEPPDDLDGYGPAMLALTPKQRAFVIRYIENPLMDASTAARLAGYSNTGTTARVKACR